MKKTYNYTCVCDNVIKGSEKKQETCSECHRNMIREEIRQELDELDNRGR